MIKRFTILGFALVITASSAGFAATESTQAKIDRALAAGPASIADRATVLDLGAGGKATVLRKGSNGWTCVPGHPGVIGDDPFCADAAGMQWGDDWMHHRKPSIKVPGVMYMLRGAHDWSATDPFATKGKPIVEPPHWMIMYPYTTATGLSTKEKPVGTWIMWAGTPYAHLMINQKP